jgi:hypothetical protein
VCIAELLLLLCACAEHIEQGNERNGAAVSELGGVTAVLDAIALHSARRDVVKSGCHALAILSDIQGQGAKIAEAGGVTVLLPALRLHVRYAKRTVRSCTHMLVIFCAHKQAVQHTSSSQQVRCRYI